MTTQPIPEKLREHNEGAMSWSCGHRPFKLIYAEGFNSKKEALRRERYFKSGQGRRTLDHFLETGSSPPEGVAEKILKSGIFPGLPKAVRHAFWRKLSEN